MPETIQVVPINSTIPFDVLNKIDVRVGTIEFLEETLGISPTYNDLHEFIPAAYDLLVLKQPVTSGDTKHYLVHKECATNMRDIFLDLEDINGLGASANPTIKQPV